MTARGAAPGYASFDDHSPNGAALILETLATYIPESLKKRTGIHHRENKDHRELTSRS
jgi:hypothetical protein